MLTISEHANHYTIKCWIMLNTMHDVCAVSPDVTSFQSSLVFVHIVQVHISKYSTTSISNIGRWQWTSLDIWIFMIYIYISSQWTSLQQFHHGQMYVWKSLLYLKLTSDFEVLCYSNSNNGLLFCMDSCI